LFCKEDATAVAAKGLIDRVTELLGPEAERHGFELVAVEQAGGRGTPVLRVLLDREGGINLDDVTVANRWVSAALDDADPVAGPYTLEVSSPGIDRPLVRLADFDRFAGQTATVKARQKGGRGSWTGAIVGSENEHVVLDVDGELVRLPFEDITKARLKGVVDFDCAEGAERR
jgi:ribosome maturation factor RimP